MSSTRDCPACGRKNACEWNIDAWVCRYTTCGSEWYPDHGPEFADPTTEHVGDVVFHIGWQEWRADCSCGRTGSYVPSRAAALADHTHHQENP